MSSFFKINGDLVGGRSVNVKNNRVFIDGNDVTPDAKIITIEVAGNIDVVSVDRCELISVKGRVGELRTASGDIEIDGSVYGNVTTASGDVRLEGSVEGNVTTSSGDVEIGSRVTGSVKTVSGDITINNNGY